MKAVPEMLGEKLLAVSWLCRLTLISVCITCAFAKCHAIAAPLKTVTHVSVENVTGGLCRHAPITFGQPFRNGDVPSLDTIVAFLHGEPLPTQTDIKARNPNGSARHAVITVQAPCIGPNSVERLSLISLRKPIGKADLKSKLSIADVLKTSFNATAIFNINGKIWSLAARPLLAKVMRRGGCSKSKRRCTQWLSGPLVSEWVVGGPLRDRNGKRHPHLAVYFAVRAYGPLPIRHIRVDVVVENDWAFQPDPTNYQYAVTIRVGGTQTYSIKNLTHYIHARWHKVFWWGRQDPLYAALNSQYLQMSRAVPSYESVKPGKRLLSSVRQDCAPMRPCDQTPHMANTGAQPAIGPLARWSAVYVEAPKSYRAFRWMLANSNALGAYNVHYRNKSTGQPVSVRRHPCMTLIPEARVSRCPVPPHGDDEFPQCHRNCRTPLSPNESHHPSPAYVAYLVTGDWYYMEELEFWANWVIFHSNPAYRHYTKGLIYDTQVRGQAWALRTLGDAAYILPDQSPLKRYLNSVVENNIRWYNEHYTDNAKANKLHINVSGYALAYSNHGHAHTGFATWQQSFFNWSLGNLADLGFKGAKKLRNWFAHFQIGLMVNPKFCWELASTYELRARETRKSPLFNNLAKVYRRTFPGLRGVPCQKSLINAALKKHRHFPYPPGTMVGYPRSPTGFTANFQIGLAAAVDSGIPGSKKAWETFISQPVRPKYSASPQFAVIPRSMPTNR